MKKLNWSSPIGIALTVAGVVLALSPEARRAVRRAMVRGTAGMLDSAEQIGGFAAGALHRQSTPVAHVGESHPVATDTNPTDEDETVRQAVKPDTNALENPEYH